MGGKQNGRIFFLLVIFHQICVWSSIRLSHFRSAPASAAHLREAYNYFRCVISSLGGDAARIGSIHLWETSWNFRLWPCTAGFCCCRVSLVRAAWEKRDAQQEPEPAEWRRYAAWCRASRAADSPVDGSPAKDPDDAPDHEIKKLLMASWDFFCPLRVMRRWNRKSISGTLPLTKEWVLCAMQWLADAKPKKETKTGELDLLE
jgi:hypothetical protein